MRQYLSAQFHVWLNTGLFWSSDFQEGKSWTLFVHHQNSKEKITGAGKDVEKLERLCAVTAHVNGAAAVQSSIALPQEIKHKIII